MEKIKTNKAPNAVGPYSQGILVGNVLYTSGQIAIDPSTNKLVENNGTEEIIIDLFDPVLREGGETPAKGQQKAGENGEKEKCFFFFFFRKTV